MNRPTRRRDQRHQRRRYLAAEHLAQFGLVGWHAQLLAEGYVLDRWLHVRIARRRLRATVAFVWQRPLPGGQGRSHAMTHEVEVDLVRHPA